jgi:NhaA family Na+:H+ antiporter
MDDLGAIIVIAVFYSTSISIAYLMGAMAILIALLGLNRLVGVKSLIPYLLGGVAMWVLMFKSGVHATIAGVMLAFAIPFSAKEDDEQSASHRLEHFLHTPVAFIILPIFALANTGLVVTLNPKQTLLNANSLGIVGGLVVGKPIGITLISYCVVAIGICRLPPDLEWRHIFGAGILGGIGFTMSIFITNLAFVGNPETIHSSKVAILSASLIAGILGYLWLRFKGKGAGLSDKL